MVSSTDSAIKYSFDYMKVRNLVALKTARAWIANRKQWLGHHLTFEKLGRTEEKEKDLNKLGWEKYGTTQEAAE